MHTLYAKLEVIRDIKTTYHTEIKGDPYCFPFEFLTRILVDFMFCLQKLICAFFIISLPSKIGVIPPTAHAHSPPQTPALAQVWAVWSKPLET